MVTLQTDDQHLGKGYARVVIKHMSKRIAEIGHDVYTDILEGNIPSRTLFGKLGFEEVGKIHYIDTKHNWSEADE